MKRKNILITEPQQQALERLARETGMTVSEHIRLAVDEYLERKGNVDRTPPPHSGS